MCTHVFLTIGADNSFDDDRQAELDLLCISILFLMKHSKRMIIDQVVG